MGAQPKTQLEDDRLFEQIRSRIIGYLTRKAGFPREDAEDVAQRSIQIALESHPTLDQPDQLVFWCIGTARNLAREEFRRRRRMVEEDFQSWPSNREGPDSDLACRKRQLEAGILKLSQKCQRAIEMFLDGTTAQEAAQVLGINVGNYNVLQNRCRERLKKAMQEGNQQPKQGEAN